MFVGMILLTHVRPLDFSIKLHTIISYGSSPFAKVSVKGFLDFKGLSQSDKMSHFPVYQLSLHCLQVPLYGTLGFNG